MSVITRSPKSLLVTSAVAAGMLAVSALPSSALHYNTIAPIDVIDGIFGPGGGTMPGMLDAPPGEVPGSGETDWYAFSATMGDTVRIHTEGPTDTIIGVFYDLSGLVEVGDDPKCANTILFDCHEIGQDMGFDLEFLAFHDDVPGSMDFNVDVTFTAGATGMYAFALQEFTKDDPGPYTVTVALNTVTPDPRPVSEPGTLALLGLGLAGLGLARRRKADKRIL